MEFTAKKKTSNRARNPPQPDSPTASTSSSDSWRSLISARRLLSLDAPRTPLPSRNGPVNHSNLGSTLNFSRTRSPPSNPSGACPLYRPAQDPPPAYTLEQGPSRSDGAVERTREEEESTRGRSEEGEKKENGSLRSKWVKMREAERIRKEEQARRERILADDRRMSDSLRGIGL